ncbi:addiction module protein [Prosthecochloris sp. HL-130-GSB]|nr:addiction module protein [Prosthecochloris sp. HL-130-GSB]
MLPFVVSTYKVQEYLLEDGSSPYGDWFMNLDAMAAAKINTVKLKLEQGKHSNVKWFRGIGEYKLDWGPGYRVYIGKDGDALILLLCGGTKKRQSHDIEKAIEYWQDYKRRKRESKN